MKCKKHNKEIEFWSKRDGSLCNDCVSESIPEEEPNPEVDDE